MRRLLLTVSTLLGFASLAFGGVSVSSPVPGATVGSPVHVVSSSSSSAPIVATNVYVDYGVAFSSSAPNVDTYVNVGAGTHTLVVQSWDAYGNVTKSGNVVFNAGASGGVSVSSPSPNATVGSPMTVTASSTMANPVGAMQVYVDGVMSYGVAGNSVNTALNVSAGAHTVVVQSWDIYGNYAKSGNIVVNVGSTSSASSSGSSSSPGVPAGAVTFSKIEEQAGWQSCNTCAGAGGAGASVPYSMSQWQSTPSMDGSSGLFWLGGSTPYSAALWWKQLGAQSNASHFVYDLYFYYTDANAAQALEFDVNQSVNGKKYIFGTECNPRGTGTWDYWDNLNQRWVSTGVACPAPPTYQWNHLVWQFERTPDGQVHYVSVTLNGVTSYINKYSWPLPSGVNELNVAFQMDGNFQQQNYKVNLDQVKLSAW